MTNISLTKNLQSLANLAKGKKLLLVTAESCTGGGIAAAITDLEGSSEWFVGGFVTYSNAMKTHILGVEKATIESEGAVSEPVVIQMTTGALKQSGADVAVAVSGVAGPGGGSKEKPVGTVWIAWQHRSGTTKTQQFLFSGDRKAIREQTVAKAIEGFINIISGL